MSDAKEGPKGLYREPTIELNFEKFVALLLGKIIGATKIGG